MYPEIVAPKRDGVFLEEKPSQGLNIVINNPFGNPLQSEHVAETTSANRLVRVIQCLN